MSEAIKMPALGESVTEGTITTWFKAVGDSIDIDEPIVEVSTDKVDTEVPSPVAGVLLSIDVGEDETVDVGTVLGYIGTPGESSPVVPSTEEAGAAPAAAEPTSAPEASAAPEASPAPAPPAEDPVPAPEPTPIAVEPLDPAPAPTAEPPASAHTPVSAPVEDTQLQAPEPTPATIDIPEDNYVTPVLRKLAKELGVDLAAVSGTGVGGRIRRQDIEAAAEAAAKAAQAPVEVPAEQAPATSSTSQALHSCAAAYPALIVEIDGTKLAYDFLPEVLKATADALSEHSALVSQAEPAIGVTLAATRGAFMPVLRDLGTKSAAQIHSDLADVTARSESGAIGPDDLFGSNFSVVDNTAQSIAIEIPQIQPTHRVALSVGARELRAKVIDSAGTIAARGTFYLSLSYDPSAADANVASSFLKAVKAKLES